jgi:predicted SAM-dependent methyltransferase
VKALITEIPSRLGRLVAGRLLPLTRDAIAARYLQGDGLEIGALHNPLPVPSGARVRYVDRMPVAELERHYPELRGKALVPVDVIDDGEQLASVPDASMDFVIANHFLEHCQDPLGALGTMFRVVRPGGIVYLAVPDKRYTFDVDRDVTQPEHLLDDHRNGPESSKRHHYEEWARFVDKVAEADVDTHATKLLEDDYSIHFHVWTQAEALELLDVARRELGLAFDVEFAIRNGIENVFVLRKAEA